MADPLLQEPNRRKQAEDALKILEEFAAAAQLRFDRTLAARGLGEAERAIPGDNAATWARRLVEVGESIDLRVQLLECTLQEALGFVRQGMPIATGIEQEDGALRWVLVCEVRGRRARLKNLESAASDHWVSLRSLPQRLGERASDGRRLWVVGQAALACQAASDPGHGHGDSHSVSPLSRLGAFLWPEKKDLWVIVVFSIIDGVLLLATPIAVEALVNTVAFGRYLQPIVVLAIMLFTFLAFAARLSTMCTPPNWSIVSSRS